MSLDWNNWRWLDENKIYSKKSDFIALLRLTRNIISFKDRRVSVLNLYYWNVYVFLLLCFQQEEINKNTLLKEKSKVFR